jgi:Domain of unknown function (DUF4386)
MSISTKTTPTTSSSRGSSTGASDRLRRFGGLSAIAAGGTFVFGIALFVTSLSDYTDPDATPSESVDFLVGHQTTLLLWYIGIFIVFGALLVPLALALRSRLRDDAPTLADASTVFAMIWAGLMFATGMISNIGIEAVSDLAETDRAGAINLSSAIDTVTNGLGGGNELVGGIWVLLVSLAAWRGASLPRGLNVLGVISAVAGLATVIPAFEAAEMAFGIGLIVWFVWLGVALLRRPRHVS